MVNKYEKWQKIIRTDDEETSFLSFSARTLPIKYPLWTKQTKRSFRRSFSGFLIVEFLVTGIDFTSSYFGKRSSWKQTLSSFDSATTCEKKPKKKQKKKHEQNTIIMKNRNFLLHDSLFESILFFDIFRTKQNISIRGMLKFKFGSDANIFEFWKV